MILQIMLIWWLFYILTGSLWVKTSCLMCFSPDFDANNIFRAFFGGHGGGFNFESSASMYGFASIDIMKLIGAYNEKGHVQYFFIDYTPSFFLCFFLSVRCWAWKFLFPVWLRRRIVLECCRPVVDNMKLDSLSPPDFYTPDVFC